MPRKVFILYFFFSTFIHFGQKLKFPEQTDFEWPDKNIKFLSIPDSFKMEDLVILNDEVRFDGGMFYRRVAIKILTRKGKEKISRIELPENFDLTNFYNRNRIGRFSTQNSPYLQKFNIRYFAARIIKTNRIIEEISPKVTYGEAYWIKRDGARSKQKICYFDFGELNVSDIIEYCYKVEIGYSTSFFYLNSTIPRVRLNIIAENAFFSFNNLSPADTIKFKQKKKSDAPGYTFNNLPAIKYPGQIFAASTLPHLIMFEWRLPWFMYSDSINRKKYNTREEAFFKSYARRFARADSDRTGNIVLAQITDSINALKFISAEAIHYSGEAQYALTSAEHLAKGRLVEEFMIKTYDRLLEEKKLFFYIVAIADKRTGEISDKYYSNATYGSVMFAVPEKKSMVFYRVREHGIKYFPNEIPFYLEDTKCVLIPQNTNYLENKELADKMVFIKTPKSTFNDNLRSEAVNIKVNIDSMKMNFTIKENLSGQFSTLLRHYYNRDPVDSTVNPVYFKRCIDKPEMYSVKIKNGSNGKVFPFKHSFNCSAGMKIMTKNEINLSGWFSFTWSLSQFTENFKQQINPDFEFTDIYNFLFDFDKPVDILNSEAFTKKLTNDYFEISCNLVKQDSNKYLLSVSVKCKQDMIPEKDGTKIMEFVEMLDSINKLQLNYKVL